MVGNRGESRATEQQNNRHDQRHRRRQPLYRSLNTTTGQVGADWYDFSPMHIRNAWFDTSLSRVRVV